MGVRRWGTAVKGRVPNWLFWPLAFSGLLAVRLPYLFSPNRLLDGDEAILGLMAKQVATLKEAPIFFWGQSYGFSLLEAFSGAVAFRVLGVSSMSLSLAMVALFFLGLWFYEGGLRNLTHNRGWSRALTLALGLLPVWMVWGFKARGGYLTAFLLGGVILRLVTGGRFGRASAFLTGSAAALLFFSQPLWWAAFLPLLLLPFVQKRAGLWEGAVVALGAVVVAVPLAVASSRAGSFWRPEVMGTPTLAGLGQLPKVLVHTMGGTFYLDRLWMPSLALTGAAVLLALAWALTLLGLGYRLLKERDLISGILALAMLASVAAVVLVPQLPPRYLLQASVILAPGCAALLGSIRRPWETRMGLYLGMGLLALAVMATSVAGFRPFHPGSSNDLESEVVQLVKTLEESGVLGIYSMDALLQWQILFYGKEAIPARFASPLDRRPEYPIQVDEALATGGRVALVGTRAQAQGFLGTPLGEGMELVGENYFAILDVPRPVLERLGFGFLNRP